VAFPLANWASSPRLLLDSLLPSQQQGGWGATWHVPSSAATVVPRAAKAEARLAAVRVHPGRRRGARVNNEPTSAHGRYAFTGMVTGDLRFEKEEVTFSPRACVCGAPTRV
jgi:hypothetical protein